MNPAIAGGRAAERVRSTERSGSVERLRLHGDGFRAHGDRPPSRHVPLHFVQMAFRVSESPTLFSGADRFDNHWILLGFKEPKRVSYALARFGPTTPKSVDPSLLRSNSKYKIGAAGRLLNFFWPGSQAGQSTQASLRTTPAGRADGSTRRLPPLRSVASVFI